jgi:hypothetical protein
MRTIAVARRRDLTFAVLGEVMPEVERLLAGHTTVGNWSLGQICRHLATALRATAASARVARPYADRPPIDPTFRRRFFEAGRFPEGVAVPRPALLPPEGLDARDEAEALRAAIDQFAATPGPFGDHPLLGPLSPEEWTRFHCIHCAHHLSFALPGAAD